MMWVCDIPILFTKYVKMYRTYLKKTICKLLIMKYNQDGTYERTMEPDRVYFQEINTQETPLRAFP